MTNEIKNKIEELKKWIEQCKEIRHDNASGDYSSYIHSDVNNRQVVFEAKLQAYEEAQKIHEQNLKDFAEKLKNEVKMEDIKKAITNFSKKSEIEWHQLKGFMTDGRFLGIVGEFQEIISNKLLSEFTNKETKG